MTDSPDNKAVFLSRVAGKWQIPLLLVGLIACGAAVAMLVLRKPAFDWDQAYQRQVQRLESISDNDYAVVERDVRAMLDPSVTPADQKARLGKLHALLGEILWRNISRNEWTQPRHWTGLQEEYGRALKMGHPKTMEIVRRLAEASAALGQTETAIAQLKDAAELDPTGEAKLYRRVLELREDTPGSRADRLTELARYLDTEGVGADRYGWALDESVDLLLRDDSLKEAEQLIGRQQARGLGRLFDRHLLYQRARVLAAEGLAEQADNILIHLAGQLEPASDLYQKALLLRGDLIWDENPVEAEGLFREVITRGASTPKAVAATVGLAKAYGRMQLYDKAIEQYEQAVAALADGRPNPHVDVRRLWESLVVAHKALETADKPQAALRYAQTQQKLADSPALTLTEPERLELLGRLAAGHKAVADRLAGEHYRAADALAGDEELKALDGRRREHLEAAGDAFGEMATAASLADDQVHGDSLWLAAEAYGEAGLREKAIAALDRFVAGRPADLRVPEARFRLGRALQADNRYDDAIEAYKANLASRVPASRHIKAVEGLIPMAQCYIAKGPEFFDEAEKILREVAGGQEGITPESALYRQALFALGRLYYQQGKWPQARRTLTEAVMRDPGKAVPAGQADPQDLRARYIRATQSKYFIAQSYQHSARALSQAAMKADAGRRRELRKAAAEQLAQAAALHQEVIDRLEVLGGDLDATEKTFRLNSYFALGDCMFELGRYEKALARYERAVFLFRRRREALGGLVAIYNCYQALGRPEKARAAMERASDLRKHVKFTNDQPPQAEAGPGVWDRWLPTVAYLDPEVSGEETR